MCVVLPLLSHVTGSRLTHPQHVTCVFSCLRLLAVLSRHNAKGLPLLLAQYPRIGETLVAAVADLPSPQKLEGLSIITQFVVNNELADAAADLAQKIQPLPESDKAFIAHKLKDPVDGACLLNVHSSCYDLPCEALCAQKFWLSEEKGAVPAELFQHESTTKQKSGDVVRALLQKRAERAYYYQRRKRQQTKKRKAARSSEDEWEDLSDDDEETAVAGTSAADALPCPAPLQTPALAPESHTPPQKVEESKCAPPSSIPSPPDRSNGLALPKAPEDGAATNHSSSQRQQKHHRISQQANRWRNETAAHNRSQADGREEVNWGCRCWCSSFRSRRVQCVPPFFDFCCAECQRYHRLRSVERLQADERKR